MNKLSDLEYLKLSKLNRKIYDFKCFICSIPSFFVSIFNALVDGIKNIFTNIKDGFVDFFATFKNGSTKTKLSYLIMGFNSLAHKQYLKGLLFLGFEIIFFVYMGVAGFYWLSKFDNLGDNVSQKVYSAIYDTYILVAGDDSFKILLYGMLTIFFIIAFIYTYLLNIKQAKILDEIDRDHKKIESSKDTLRSLIDENFHKTLLALPVAGITFFTVMPIIFMVLVAFTNYDGYHDGFSNLFTWVGLDNFNALLVSTSSDANLPYTFMEILSWTLMWAFFATFTNYFLGMFVAILINKKGIKFKKLWRGILVLTIAIPQFVSLLYVSKLFAKTGLVNGFLMNWGLISKPIEFWINPKYSRILVILINIWIGIPYLMLIATGILMNIPDELYESSKIDGASVFDQYTRITLPYMLFVTGPYLLTSFTGNINNFNVIFLLTSGQAVDNPLLTTSGGNATSVDLLITWLFKITTGATSNYKLAAVISIMIFIVIAGISLIVYNIMPSTKNEEDYS